MTLARPQIPILLVFFLIIIAIVNTLAGMHHWYWTMRWFDMPMHFAGGAWLAFFGSWWYYARRGESPNSFLSLLAVCLLFTIVIGVMWEAYEAMVGLITVGHVNKWSDTNSDLALDFLGGIVAVLILWFTRKNSETKVIS